MWNTLCSDRAAPSPLNTTIHDGATKSAQFLWKTLWIYVDNPVEIVDNLWITQFSPNQSIKFATYPKFGPADPHRPPSKFGHIPNLPTFQIWPAPKFGLPFKFG
jgi:hypothetical protein